ncbi:MAG: hypothetical protein ACE5E8_08890 [Acidimicrobiia bacterium]
MATQSGALMLLLRASAIMLVFPFRLVIFLGLIWFFGGSRAAGLTLIAGGVAGYALWVAILRVGSGRRPDNETDPTKHWEGEIHSDRSTFSVSEAGWYQGAGWGRSGLSRRARSRK